VDTSLHLLLKTVFCQHYHLQEVFNRHLGDESSEDSCLLSNNVKIKIYKTIILPLVLYGCEACLTQRMAVFEYMLMRMFGSKREEVTGGWRKLHNEELHNLYFSPDIIRVAN
jgi:hypothetical protein